MIDNCPHCKAALRFNPEQKQKLHKALALLEKGKLLTLKCPHCMLQIKIDQTGNPPVPARSNAVAPPAPPNLDWLVTGKFTHEEKVEDVPMALVLFKDTEQRSKVIAAIESVGYQVITAEKPQDAIERMRFVNFSCVVFQADLEGNFATSTFHQYLRKMPMERRRYIFYIIIGKQFNTLYNLEALAYSANLTINTVDIKHLEVILLKAIPEYEELFGPLLEELSSFGKR